MFCMMVIVDYVHKYWEFFFNPNNYLLIIYLTQLERYPVLRKIAVNNYLSKVFKGWEGFPVTQENSG